MTRMDHWDEERRKKFAQRIAALHDPENGEEGDAPICPLSLQAMQDFVAVMRPEKVPSLGAGFDGVVTATWGDAEARISFTFNGEYKSALGKKFVRVSAGILVTSTEGG